MWKTYRRGLVVKTVKDACLLAPGALEIRVSNQVEHLEQLIRDEGDGSSFFTKTYVTRGLHDLVTGGMSRLSGASKQPIFHLKQAMGGGKTHLLVALGLIAGNPALLKDDAVLRDTFPNLASNVNLTPSRIAAFNGRNTPPAFFWGAIADQLGAGEAFSRFWVSGPKAPDPSDWKELFGDEPTLILLDEMPPYFDYLASQAFAPGVAAIATRAFANLLVAANECPRVCVVVSDLTVSYEAGRELINLALRNAADELGRQETTITPVDLATEEIYEILRKRLFTRLPGEAEISDIATAYGRALEEAAQANTAGRSAEAISDEIVQTYPFHPRLKSVFALFKENENFKQTRGLLELVSRLLQSVWSRTDNDVHLIGAQHFDLSIQEVRDKLDEFSGLRDVVSRDVWDSQGEAHAQVLDLKIGNDVTTQTATLLLMASLSTAVNTVRGLTKPEMVEALVSPLRQASDFLAATDQLEEAAWYMHHTPEGRYYFDRQENLTKMLQGFAAEAPDNQIDDLIRKRLTDMFRPRRKTVYEEVLALPRLQEVSDVIRSKRVLLIVDPDTKVPPEQIADLFSGLTAKNNLCVLTGDKTAMASVTQAARHVFASGKAGARIPSGHPQREELDRKTQEYELRFTTTILSLFDKVLFPTQRRGQAPALVSKALDQTRDTTAQFDGEEQIEKTLIVDPLKLYVEVEPHFDALREKAETLLWPEGQPVVRNEEFIRRAAEQAAMPWLPPRELDKLKAIAFSRGLWEDLRNGSMTKAPVAKQTSVQPVRILGPADDGTASWELNAVEAGPAPVIHFSEEGPATTKSPKLSSNQWSSKALRVSFLAVDPSGKHETGPAVEAINAPKVRNRLTERDGRRFVELRVAPVGELHYSVDGSEPRNGTFYTESFEISNDPTTVLVHCDADGVEVRETFIFPATTIASAGTTSPVIDGAKPARLEGGRFTFDSRASALRNVAKSAELGVVYGCVNITIGEGSNSLRLMTMGDDVRSGESLQKVIDVLLEGTAESVPMTFKFKWAQFHTGETLQQFADECHLTLQVGEVIQ
jgi:hypothetical protein